MAAKSVTSSEATVEPPEEFEPPEEDVYKRQVLLTQ